MSRPSLAPSPIRAQSEPAASPLVGSSDGPSSPGANGVAIVVAVLRSLGADLGRFTPPGALVVPPTLRWQACRDPTGRWCLRLTVATLTRIAFARSAWPHSGSLWPLAGRISRGAS